MADKRYRPNGRFFLNFSFTVLFLRKSMDLVKGGGKFWVQGVCPAFECVGFGYIRNFMRSHREREGFFYFTQSRRGRKGVFISRKGF